MKLQEFLKALEIISANHSTELIINKPVNNFVGDLGTTKFTLQIKNCCASVINKLLAEKYSVSMVDGLLSVDKY